MEAYRRLAAEVLNRTVVLIGLGRVLTSMDHLE